MAIVVSLLLIIGSFLFMEFMAWFTHKYIMHGFMWIWHESHHKPHDHKLEKNDLFSAVFALPAIACIVTGCLYPSLWFLKWIGIGITGYGLFYFIFHDIIVHRRVNIKFIAKSSYMKRLIRAHKIHHKSMEKDGGESFGFLYASKKYKT